MNVQPHVDAASVPVLTEVIDVDWAESLPPALPVLTEAVPLTFADPGLAAQADSGAATVDAAPADGSHAQGSGPPQEPEAADGKVAEAQEPAGIDPDAIVQQVLAALQPHLDGWLEARLADALAPSLERLARALVAEARDELGAVLRGAVRDAVDRALEERRPG